MTTRWAICLWMLSAVCAATEPPYTPKIALASDEAAKAIRKMRVPAGFKVSLFAAEPLLANPVAFHVDERGRFYVCETFRLHAGVTDNRNHMDWLDDDLACRTVADRVEMYQKHLKEKFPTYASEHDRVRLVEDRDGDGKADHSSVFADGFKNAADGIGAGVLSRRGQVYFACIPDLWLLQDKDRDGKAELRRSLQTGYGVHVAFLGHDLHGLRFGPDGRLYFSIGDRGLSVWTPRGTLDNPDSGAVLRCEPDGSGLEIFATGLRNPQELAFNEFGDLFSCDNNSDSGDKARWVHIVEGSDAGWRMYYQYITRPVSRGPWNAEKLWQPHFEGQAAYIVPPLANFADGPSGLAYYPGTGMPEKYRGHFFLADFRGSSALSGVRSLALRPKGASFEITDAEMFLWNVLATDVDFGPDGALYISDWTEGWDKPGKGRIFKLQDPESAKDPIVGEVRRLIAQGMAHRPPSELAKLLGHPDQRVRQEAQFALVERGPVGEQTLASSTAKDRPLMARIHAIWGLGQLARLNPIATFPLIPLLGDSEPEIRCQAVKVLGDARAAHAGLGVTMLTADPSPRVRMYAALALSKMKVTAASTAAISLLIDNADKDPFLRHAGVMVLAEDADDAVLEQASKDPSPAARMGALLAYRRLRRPEAAGFLKDSDFRVVVEAARAIYDTPIEAALPKLASLADAPTEDEVLGRRILSSNARLGTLDNARALAKIASSDWPTSLRVEALEILGEWGSPNARDRVLGAWRPIHPRSAQIAVDALGPAIAKLLTDSPTKVRLAAVDVVARLGLRNAGSALFAVVINAKELAKMRADSLDALQKIGDPRLAEATAASMRDKNTLVRAKALQVLAGLHPKDAVQVCARVLDEGSILEQQQAVAILGASKDSAATKVLAKWLGRLISGQTPPEIRLDLLEAAKRRKESSLDALLSKYESTRSIGDPLAKHRDVLYGGDAEAGRTIFRDRAEVSCLKCHKLDGKGGEVGPELTGLAGKKSREYLLESLVDPNRQIAQGFDTVVLSTADGQIHSGVLKEENDQQVQLMTPEAKRITVPKSQIEERSRGKSAMPDNLVQKLSPMELRNLVEFLAGLK